MNKILTLILTVVCFGASLACAETKTKYIKADEYEGVVFPSQYNSKFLNADVAKAIRWEPNEADIAEAEKLSMPLVQAKGVCRGQELKNYKRQYVGFINEKGEKIVWINYFMSSAALEYWTKEVVFVDDGGCGFFNIEVDLTAKDVLKFLVNGVA